jgi:hypothetical protein
MSDLDEAWPRDTALYSFDEIPVGQDLFLIGEDQLEHMQQVWRQYLSPAEARTLDHPNQVLRIRWCAIEARRPESCDVNVCIDMHSRFHGTVHVLPRSQFIMGVHFYDCERRPYLVVTKEWVEHIEATKFSLYALVDAIGMKALLNKQGHIEPAQIESLRTGVDAIAEQHVDHAFFSFADTVLVKTLWSATAEEYGRTYRPEEFLGVVAQVRRVFGAALGLQAYGIVTQGSNQLVEENLLHISERRNHIFLGSLGTPFAQLFQIDEAVRSALRRNAHQGASLYLTESLFLTLRFRHHQERDRFLADKYPFGFRQTPESQRSYIPADADDLVLHLEAPRGAV